MITSLAELNNAVNSVVNYLTVLSCNETTDGTFRIELDDIDLKKLDGYISWDDLYGYGEFIAGELAGRKEIEDVDFNDHEFSIVCNRLYCPNLEDRDPDEPLAQIHDTLSMTELSQIGETAISKLQGADISSLRDTLGMDFLQAYKLGLLQQNHFFSVELGDGSISYWSADVASAINRMRHQCVKGTAPCLCYNYLDLEKGRDVIRIPLAEECCGKIAAVPGPVSYRPTTPSYLDAVASVEAAIYDLPPGYLLSYRMSSNKFHNQPQHTLKEAATAFLAMSEKKENPVLYTQITGRHGKIIMTARATQKKGGRISVKAKQFGDNPLDSQFGSFYPDLSRLLFPGREMGIDDWQIRVIALGETYGRENHLKNDGPMALVEFRDMRSVSENLPGGSVISRLELDVLVGHQGRGGLPAGSGLILDASSDTMRLSAEEMAPILTWLRLKEIEISKEKTAGLEEKIQSAKARCAGPSSESRVQRQTDIEH